MAERGRNKGRGPLSKEKQKQRKERTRAATKEMLETFTPLGDVQTAKDASKAFQEGRYLDAAGNAALIAAGYTPLGPLARPAGRLAKRVARDKDMLLPALTDKDYAGLVARETIMGKGPLAPKSAGAASARTKAEKQYKTTSGYHPLELAILKNKGLDPEKYQVYFHGTPKKGVSKDIAGGEYVGPDGKPLKTFFLAEDPMVSAIGYATDETGQNLTGGLSSFIVPKGALDKYQINPISGAKRGTEKRVNTRNQFQITPDELEKIIEKSGIEPVSTDYLNEILNFDYYKKALGQDPMYTKYFKE